MSTERQGNWERRWHALLDQWVIIASTSAGRPWSGAMASVQRQALPAHDPGCYLCPRVVRANGAANPDYSGPFAFNNDFPSLAADAPDVSSLEDSLTRRAPARGRCRVLCWSERHDATLANISPASMVDAARLWQDEYTRLKDDPTITFVQMFENKGTEIGVSNLHPHGQIYACEFMTDTGKRFRDAQARYAREHGGASLMLDMLNHETVQSALVVEKNTYWSVIVPFAARFAYETWIVPHRSMRSIADAQADELEEFALCYQRQVRRYDVLFKRSAPNITLLYNAPCDSHADNTHWCFHLAFQPPLRDPEKMKFLAGFEAGSANIINPVQPEQAAEQLRQIKLDDWAALGLELPEL